MTSVLSLFQDAIVHTIRVLKPSKKPKHPRLPLTFESCEERSMLAADIAITGFNADGSHLIVHYDVSGDNAPPFDINVYSTPDGTNLTLCGSARVENAADLAV